MGAVGLMRLAARSPWVRRKAYGMGKRVVQKYGTKALAGMSAATLLPFGTKVNRKKKKSRARMPYGQGKPPRRGPVLVKRAQYLLAGKYRGKMLKPNGPFRADPLRTCRKVDSAHSYSAKGTLYMGYDDVTNTLTYRTIGQNIAEMIFRKLKSAVKYVHEVPATVRVVGGGNDNPDQPIANRLATIQMYFGRDDTNSSYERKDFTGTELVDRTLETISNNIGDELLARAHRGFYVTRICCLESDNKLIADFDDLELMHVNITAKTNYRMQNITKGLNDSSEVTNIGANPLTGIFYDFSRPGIRLRDGIHEAMTPLDQLYMQAMLEQETTGRIATENMYRGDYQQSGTNRLIPPFQQPPSGGNTFVYLRGTATATMQPGGYHSFIRQFSYKGTLKKFMRESVSQHPQVEPAPPDLVTDKRLPTLGGSFLIGLEHGIRGETRPAIEVQIHRDQVVAAKVTLPKLKQIPAHNFIADAVAYS